MSIFSYVKHHVFIASVSAVVLIFVVVLAGRAANQKPEAEVNSGAKKVSVVNASVFREGNISVNASGVVESVSQADLRSQMNAPVAVINTSVGQSVYAGQVILELSNSDIRAQLSQAQASLAQAQGQQYTGTVSLQSAKQGAIDKIRDAYLKSYDAVITQVDPILNNNTDSSTRLLSLTTNSQLTSEIVITFVDLKNSYSDWNKIATSLNTATSTEIISNALDRSQALVEKTELLLNDISKVLNDANASSNPTVAAWKNIVSGARASISGAAQGLTGAEMTFSTSNATRGTTLEAGVSAAEAGVRNLEAQLAKTIIRSPISGRISSLPLRIGELASPGALLATVIGEGTGLIIKTYVSGDDLQRIRAAAPVIIENFATGTVSNFAPSVDPLSKKAEVDIAVLDAEKSRLVIGQNVSVTIIGDTTSQSSKNGNIYLVPLQNIKIVPGSAYMYTVDADSKIQKHEVILGKIRGDFVEVVSGITDDMNIVTPVYELDEGQSVQIQ